MVVRERLGTRKASREGVEFARGWRRGEGVSYGEGRPLREEEEEGEGRVEV